MKLILVRHGETIWNADGRYQGRFDVPLSQKGLWEAARAAEKLKDEPITAIYSSNLIRARETARIIAAPHGLEVQVLPDLAELDFGDWEGLTANEIKARFGEEAYRTWMEDPAKDPISGGEPVEEFVRRLGECLQSIIDAHPNQTVAVVAHGGAFMMLGCRLQGEELKNYRNYWHHNAGISVLNAENGSCRFEVLNCVSHLADDKSAAVS